MTITLQRLRDAVAKDAAMRRVQKLQPAGGPGDKIFPPTYPGERSTDPARHVFETRRIDGKDVRCVLIDSVQSQANRLEEALLGAMRARRIAMPYISVAFKDQTLNGMDLSDLGEITSLDAPHRVFDAVIRDSELDGVKFTNTDHYKALLLAKPTNATEVFKLSPTSLVFGVWNSTGEGGGLGAKFARCIVSEIIGVGAAEGQKAAVRIDPLESVREHQAGLQSFRSMRRIDARRKNASALRLRFSQSLASLRQRLSQAMVRSTTQRRGSTTNPLA